MGKEEKRERLYEATATPECESRQGNETITIEENKEKRPTIDPHPSSDESCAHRITAISTKVHGFGNVYRNKQNLPYVAGPASKILRKSTSGYGVSQTTHNSPKINQ